MLALTNIAQATTYKALHHNGNISVCSTVPIQKDLTVEDDLRSHLGCIAACLFLLHCFVCSANPHTQKFLALVDQGGFRVRQHGSLR